MLTNLVEGYGYGCHKCSQYWPDEIGAFKRFGDLKVQLYDCQNAPDYKVRKLDVSSSTEAREVVHVQFVSWPDRSAPEEPGLLLQLIEVCSALSGQYNPKGTPWVVHCSAGVGRTGTFIAVEQLLRMLKSQDSVDVFNHVYNLRKERCFMVQSEAQYVYVYKCLLEHLRRAKINEDEEKATASTSLLSSA